ncbi:ABC transporter substrate-binding protein [Candidatus Pelagibacter sp.]|nr:ABC transporter substrate-binding protein [Candidatus Pelagibacter sp.]
MKAHIRYYLIIIFLITFPKVAFGNNQIKIGLLAPFTGEFENIGKSIISSARIALNKINNDNISIFPRDTKGNNLETLKQVEELYTQGVRIFIGPVFNKNLKGLEKFKDAYFLSLTNKILNNPKNVISAGINARSQFNAIKKYQKLNELEKTLVLIPKKDYKEEIEHAIKETRLKAKKVFYYDTEPTKLTKQIEKVTRYRIRKQNLEDEISRIENSNEDNKEKKLENLNKKDTLGKIGYDSVIIADFDESLKSVTTSLLYTDVSPKKVSFISLNQWFDKTLFKETASQPISFPSINKENFDKFKKNYREFYDNDPNQLSLITYDLVGIIYYLLIQNDFEITDNIFKKEIKFKGKSGVFQIKNKKINHELNFYSVEKDKFIKIF